MDLIHNLSIMLKARSLKNGLEAKDGEAVARRAIERFHGAWVDNRRLGPSERSLLCILDLTGLAC